MPAMLNASPSVMFVNHKMFNQTSAKQLTYLGGIQQTTLQDGAAFYVGCFANFTTFFAGPQLGCPLGTTGFVGLGDANRDGVSDAGFYLSISNITTATTIAPFRDDIASLIAAPKSTLPRPNNNFIDGSGLIWYNMLGENALAYELTYMNARTQFENRVSQNEAIVPGVYSYKFSRVRPDPFTGNEIEGIMKVNHYSFIDGYPSFSKRPSGWRIKNGRWSNSFAEVDPRSFGDLIWDGMTSGKVTRQDDLHLSITAANEKAWVTTDAVAASFGDFANAAEMYEFGRSIGFPVTNTSEDNPSNLFDFYPKEILNYRLVTVPPLADPPIVGFQYQVTDPLTGIVYPAYTLTDLFTNELQYYAFTTAPQPLMYNNPMALGNANRNIELAPTITQLSDNSPEGMSPSNIVFPPALREQQLRPLANGYRMPPIPGARKGMLLNVVLNIRRGVNSSAATFDGSQNQFRIPVRLVDAYSGHYLIEYPYGSAKTKRAENADFDLDGIKNIVEFAYSADDGDEVESTLEWTTFNQFTNTKPIEAKSAGYLKPVGAVPSLLTAASGGVIIGTASDNVSPLTASASKRVGVGNSVTYGYEVCYDTTIAKPKWIRLKAPSTGNTVVVTDKKAAKLAGAAPFTWTITNTFDNSSVTPAVSGSISISASAALPAKVSIRPTAWVTKGY